MTTQVPSLKPNDVVDIIAPGARCHPSVLDKVKTLLESWQLQCHIPEDLFGEDLLFSNSDEKRFEHLHKALYNKESKAVWCLLGGFGSTRLIPGLSQLKAPAQSKIFMGFSDITALHLFLQGQWGWATVHAPSARQAAINKVASESVALVKSILFREKEKLDYSSLQPLNLAAQKEQTLEAPIIGGNLHLIQTSLGTLWQMDAKGKIILLEEINERAYRVDRALEHLRQAGVFAHAKAIILGDFIGGEEEDGRVLVPEALLNFAKNQSLPIVQVKGVGHGAINNPIVLGKPATLKLGAQASLSFTF